MTATDVARDRADLLRESPRGQLAQARAQLKRFEGIRARYGAASRVSPDQVERARERVLHLEAEAAQRVERMGAPAGDWTRLARPVQVRPGCRIVGYFAAEVPQSRLAEVGACG